MNSDNKYFIKNKYEILHDESVNNVAVWINVGFAEDNLYIGWFDHDFYEGGSCGGKDASILEGFSYINSFKEDLVKALEVENVKYEKITCIYLLYNYEFKGPIGLLSEADKSIERVSADAEARFIGNFEFNRDS
jgi:hypothetical protein